MIIPIRLQTCYNFSCVDPHTPLQLLPHLVTLLMGQGNVTHPGITPVREYVQRQWYFAERKEAPNPMRKEGQVEARRMMFCAGDTEDV